ncbi:C4-dicarboxylate transporter, DctQ subunit [Monaibacterium marinum]|uniref:TRAP transporter small permease protein n=1 Tax=Pontivivens marinum TaxID=1690039 RepID=A0A2C9CPD4_9RHOB|nr:TRAP transporter small permease [Monaibacterium marinum]SOH92229.1 C4-dicarboxylate transporter, DctQ subunit [Monaibacterium marinum]
MNMVPQSGTPAGRATRFVSAFEENAIALILGLMTMITFVNVVLRYGFGSSLLWGLEVVTYLFAWLVLFGMSYAVKITAHLGVDALTNVLPSRGKRIAAIVTAIICVAYAFLLFKGAWDYWAPFANLDQTTGRWFPTGFNENTRENGWYETQFIPMLEFLRFLEPTLLIEGDPPYSKLPRVIPYIILPIGTALLLFRFIQAAIRVVQGKQDSLIVSHEAEDAVEEAAEKMAREERN